ncbi:MAG: FAD-dependent oxidoreductase [Pseudohongiellaceae bacterium]|nr:FAD-dependent oxidoreductase [Pseudohongiellaceae bacterium]
MSSPVTRREFLNLLAATSGTAAVLGVTAALGMIPNSTHASVPKLQGPKGDKRKVLVLGAGMSGLTVAYEMDKAGYDVTLLEASNRAGGRVFTVRSGTLIDEIGNPQVCDFDDDPHMYFNAGAARIPSTHKNVLHYCRELGVELEMFINENKDAWIQDDNIMGGQRIRNRELSTNVRGFLGELMAKSMQEEDMDSQFTDEEAEIILSLVRSFGDLDENYQYTGSNRAGYASGDYVTHTVQKAMIDIRDLLKAQALRIVLTDNEGETGPMLMQAVGGNDNIPYGFVRKIQDKIQFNSQVTEIELQDDGVRVEYIVDEQRHSIEADYCFNCIPSHLVTGLKTNLPDDYIQALKYIRRGTAIKGAFQAKERFWEYEGIYGGISWTNQYIRQIWYPAHAIHAEKGVVLAAYNYGDGLPFTQMNQNQRIEMMLSQGEKVHPDYRDKVEKGITIAWHRMNHMLGCSARWSVNTDEEKAIFARLQAPVDGKYWCIGDQVSHHPAWMESAIQSAHFAMAELERRVNA